MPRNVESTLNTALGQLLSSRHPKWILNQNLFTECTDVIDENVSARLDLLVHPHGGQPVAIETEFIAGPQVEMEAKSRLGKTVKSTGDRIESAIAVAMPPNLRQSPSNLETCELKFCIQQLNEQDTCVRWPEQEWLTGNIEQLTDAIEYISLSERRLQIGVNTLEKTVSTVSKLLLREVGECTTLQEISNVLHQDPSEQTVRMAVAILINAMVFHCNIIGQPGIPKLDEIRQSGYLQSSILNKWNQILEVNYWPIFSIAQDILRCIPIWLTPRIFERISQGAEALVSLGSSTFHDLSGRMFQTLISDRKFLATFYTLPASAKLLADLAVDRLQLDWGNREAISALKIADFACGTGALLSAVQREIYRRFRRAGGDDASIHQHVIEKILIGSDIMPAATHITASMLSSPHPRVTYGASMIHTLPYGKDEHDLISIGALDLLDGDYAPTIFNTTPQSKRMDGSVTHQGNDSDSEFRVPDGSCDIVIMNPPFTRPTNHEIANVPVPSFAGFGTTSDEQHAMSTKLKKVASKIKTKTKGQFGSGHAGLASNFMDLAHAKLKKGGVMAMVLPFSFAMGASWNSARKMLDKCYDHIRVIALSTDGSEDRAFSADTGMAECLLIATKVRSEYFEDEKSGGVAFSSLPSRPQTFLAVRKAIDHIWQDHDFKESILDAGGVGVRDKSLLETIDRLLTGLLQLPRSTVESKIPIVRLGQIANRGIVHREISNKRQGAFDVRPINSGEIPTFPMLWSHNCESERHFLVQPDSCGDVRTGYRDKSTVMWKTYRSKLHSNLDFRVNSQSLTMCLTPEPCLGGSAWPNLIPHHDDHEVPLLLWANSTLGLILFWYKGTRQQQGRTRLTISRLPELPVLDIRTLTSSQIELCQNIFERFKERSFLPANEAYRDETRKGLDAALFNMLGLSESLLESLDLLRLKWCQEPSVHGGKSTRPLA